jgi:phenylpyruvate tautomerase PptA (4-oxalocrotonate tautomerase family)
MPKIIVHSPVGTFDAAQRHSVAAELTDFAIECEALPASPFVKSTVWTYFNEYAADAVYMGASPASLKVISIQVFVLEGGLDAAMKARLIAGATEILGRKAGLQGRIPVSIVIQEIAESLKKHILSD